MTDPPLTVFNSSMGRQSYLPNFASSVSKDGTVRIQKTAVLSTKALASQENKSKSDLRLMNKYELLPGSLKKAFSNKCGNQSFAVQVLSVRSKLLQISDGLNTIPSCFADCDITNIRSAPNPVILITRWSLIQIIKTESVPPPGSVSLNVKPQYGLKLQEYSVIENLLPLPVIGNPKITRVIIYKKPVGATDPLAAVLQRKRLTPKSNRVTSPVNQSEMEVPHVDLDAGSLSRNQIETMIIGKLRFLNIDTQSPAAEAYQVWVRNICQAIKSGDHGYYCAICEKLANRSNITASFVTHIQKHHSEFPGYRCPKSGCFLPDLLKFQKHQIMNSCQEKTPYVEVPSFDEDICKSFVRKPKPYQKSKVASVKLVSSNILKSLDSHFMSSDQDTRTESSFDELWKDLSTEFKEDQQIPKSARLVSMEETDAVLVTGTNVDNIGNPSEILSSTSESVQAEVKDDCSDEADSQAFNWQEELDRMANLEEMDITANSKEDSKLAKLENKNLPANMSMNTKARFVERNNQRDEENQKITASLGKDEAIPVHDLNTPPNKKQRLLTYNADVCQPFNWQTEMDKRIKKKGKRFQCNECGLKAQGHKAMISHLETYHLRDMLGFKCPKCDSMCDTFLTFNEHMKIKHKVKLSLLKKDVDEEKLNEETSFSFIKDSIEMLQSESDEPFDWQKEVKNMIVKDGEDLNCSVCRFSSQGKKNMLTHIEKEHMENLLGFRCHDCDILFPTFVNFNQHMNINHNVHMNLLKNGSLIF